MGSILVRYLVFQAILKFGSAFSAHFHFTISLCLIIRSIAFVRNSARLKSPKPFLKGRPLYYQFDAMFQFVIKDRALRNFYRERQDAVHDHCCTACLGGGTCAAVGYGFPPLALMN